MSAGTPQPPGLPQPPPPPQQQQPEREREWHKFASYFCACRRCGAAGIACRNRVPFPGTDACQECKTRCATPSRPLPAAPASAALLSSVWDWEYGGRDGGTKEGGDEVRAEAEGGDENRKEQQQPQQPEPQKKKQKKGPDEEKEKEKERGKEKEKEKEVEEESDAWASLLSLPTGFAPHLGLEVPLPNAAHFRPEGPRSAERSTVRTGLRYGCLCRVCGCKELFRYQAAMCWRCAIECRGGEAGGKGKGKGKGKDGEAGQGRGEGTSSFAPEMSGAL